MADSGLKATETRPWRLAGSDDVPSESWVESTWLWSRLRPMPPAVGAQIAADGLRPAGVSPDSRSLFFAAAQVLAENAELENIVVARTTSIYVLEAAPGYDISHSEPHWPDRIFVSVPERHDRLGALRLAESVIHEAMHLHLTLFEQHTPLVADVEGEVPSPWREAPRPYGGVLHGLFVFCCIARFLCGLHEKAGGAPAGHVARRVAEIEGEISEVDVEALAAGLTPAGRAFARTLMSQTASGPLSGRFECRG